MMIIQVFFLFRVVPLCSTKRVISLVFFTPPRDGKDMAPFFRNTSSKANGRQRKRSRPLVYQCYRQYSYYLHYHHYYQQYIHSKRVQVPGRQAAHRLPFDLYDVILYMILIDIIYHILYYIIKRQAAHRLPFDNICIYIYIYIFDSVLLYSINLIIQLNTFDSTLLYSII